MAAKRVLRNLLAAPVPSSRVGTEAVVHAPGRRGFLRGGQHGRDG